MANFPVTTILSDTNLKERESKSVKFSNVGVKVALRDNGLRNWYVEFGMSSRLTHAKYDKAPSAPVNKSAPLYFLTVGTSPAKKLDNIEDFSIVAVFGKKA